MAVTWQFRDSILVVTLVGKYTFDDPIQVVTDAMSNPQFRAGTSLLIDAQRSGTGRSSEQFRAWASQPHQYSLAKMAGIHLNLQNLTLEIFTDFEQAICWLAANGGRK
jgi:hypothetical protein